MNGRREEVDPHTGVAIGLGIAAAAALIGLLLPIFLNASPAWRRGSLIIGAVVASIGIGGALIDLAKIRGNETYQDWGVSAIFVGPAFTLLAIRRLDLIDGLAGFVVTAFAVIMLLIGIIGFFIGLGHWAKAKAIRGEGKGPANGSAPPLFTPFQAVVLAVDILGVIVQIAALFQAA